MHRLSSLSQAISFLDFFPLQMSSFRNLFFTIFVSPSINQQVNWFYVLKPTSVFCSWLSIFSNLSSCHLHSDNTLTVVLSHLKSFKDILHTTLPWQPKLEHKSYQILKANTHVSWCLTYGLSWSDTLFSPSFPLKQLWTNHLHFFLTHFWFRMIFNHRSKNNPPNSLPNVPSSLILPRILLWGQDLNTDTTSFLLTFFLWCKPHCEVLWIFVGVYVHLLYDCVFPRADTLLFPSLSQYVVQV